ncbi:glycosyltransferase family 2 protein [Acetobacter sp.]|jgi:glycosyltransferase involved in cell wall biosynthesis|uniref:glycosyltransferase family 2 protein n=1 Tax=Acetobacter sp. TaxID=440 RepID=UPI0025BF55B5|nr:glycosyltransferase family A protein [Acetobacter sp.]MCH4092431.1 glycosyltransferase family 2 protein [Acetobacter sp.]MCI1299564.1 glycosyltransferase family 2 protein [Acetobacter sp.]MCI1315556.1 glycosyltransferase family 2 protein [Acetobacter sp.]
MRFSLVIPTLDRPGDVRAFLDALTRQTFHDLEVILVDQSGGDIYDSVVADFSKVLPVRHIRIDVRKCRYACIVGASHATGDIIAFPDDDCLYLPDTLEQVDASFRKNPSLGLLTGVVLNQHGRPSQMGRWLTTSARLNENNIWTGLVEFNMFIRRAAYEAVGGFDANMGPGCRFVAAEGQDLGLRLLAHGVGGYFDTRLQVVHPDKPTGVNLMRARSYARGMGYALRKNAAPWSVLLKFVVRPVGGIFFNILKGDRNAMLYHAYVLLGRIEGYYSSAARLAAKMLGKRA